MRVRTRGAEIMIRTARLNTHRAPGLVLALALSLAALAGCSAPAAETDRGSAGSSGSGKRERLCAGSEKGQGRGRRRSADFEFETMDGQTAELSDYRGKVVVLTFWATWCGYCMRDMPNWVEIDQAFDSVQIVAINRGDRDANARPKRRTRIRFRLGDSTKTVR